MCRVNEGEVCVNKMIVSVNGWFIDERSSMGGEEVEDGREIKVVACAARRAQRGSENKEE